MKYAIVNISDIHYRKKEPEGASTITNAFINDLKEQIITLSDYKFYLAITGDIVYMGNDNEAYQSFSEEFDQKLTTIGLSKEHRLLVPGNHDLDRNVVTEDFQNYIKRIEKFSRTEQSFNNFITDKNPMDQKFDNYELFESEFAKYGLHFSTQGQGWYLDDTLGVYCLNTALCSAGGANGQDDERKLAVSTRGLVDWCKKKTTTMNILLMHHPINYLNGWSQNELRHIIENNFCLCLYGHRHKQEVFHNKLSQKALVCSAPPLFTDKEDKLGYAIVLIEDNCIDKIVYRQYIQGKFLNGIIFSENNEGIVDVQNDFLKNKKKLERALNNSLSLFKDQPIVFIKPMISEAREFNDKENLLDQLIEDPKTAIITAPPQFGLTCLSHHMRLEAYKKNKFWIYIDTNHTKSKNILEEIKNQVLDFDKKHEEIQCIILDSWDSKLMDHKNILKRLDSEYEKIPIILMSNYSEYHYNSDFNFAKLKHAFTVLHLQALQRNKVRELVSNFNQKNNIATEDIIVTKLVKDLEVLNIHRTPLNCLTLLKVFEKDFTQALINRTKMIKAVLFILFTDSDSFTYASNKPDVDDCEYILGRFCKGLIEKRNRKFLAVEFLSELKNYCKEKLISVDVETIINILESNKILLRFDDKFEFKHRYWIFYFAATYMRQDKNFRNYVLNDKNYVNFPELIEFYTGIDGRRENAVRTLLKDTNELIHIVEKKIGISGEFNPFKGVVWRPSEEKIQAIREAISEKVKKSNLPIKIKDQHADEFYDSQAPYDQSINKFLNDYSVISLMQGIKASSRALRNSNYIDPELKLQMFESIMNGWEQLSRVIFWLSPTLAKSGRATYEGFGLILSPSFEGSFSEKLKNIYTANPYNVVNYLKDDISSNKIGPIVFENLKNNASEIQKHFISLFLVSEKPDGWYNHLYDHMNLLHRNSFYLGDIASALEKEINRGFISDKDANNLKQLVSIIVAKHKNAPKISRKNKEAIPNQMTLNKKNRLPIDKIIASGKKTLI